MDATTAKQLRRLRTLGRGASGAVVWLASDDASGQLLAVKSAGAGAADTLRREGSVMAGLCSPHIVPCLGSRAAPGGEYQLFLEFAPRGSLADEAARSGGSLAERAIQGYAADVARGLAYLHGNSLVHGDVKARNVMVGADGRAKLADFGCARAADSDRTIGGTPAFMAPEVARGEEQGLAADVWALGCTVIEMATGRAPWSDMDDVLAAVHRIGYTDAVPELPASLSPQAKDFLRKCFARNPRHRSTAAQLLEHPFLASAFHDVDAEPAKQDWIMSPESTLNAEFWESDEESETEDMLTSAAERIGSLASPCSALPDWESDDGWIVVHGGRPEASETTTPTAIAGTDFGPWSEEGLEAEVDVHFADADAGRWYDLVRNVDGAHYFGWYERDLGVSVVTDRPLCLIVSHGRKIVKFGCHCDRERTMHFDFAQIFRSLELPSHAVCILSSTEWGYYRFLAFSFYN
ncbi:mitogen-activated protein kinase kinase kinase 18-like [Triticum urartu]|uniref:mitogen-activated protein kinase kinase kinase 18-like n=1 Tax=Triticum urartu TaxID=4572 RepID=UPI0020447EBA|nr:mitogen-activated protein kinase kinase kinase 18-like [Triticum urartu]